MIALISTIAAAQVPGEADYVPPNVDADPYVAVVDADRSLATENARIHEGASARAELLWIHDPLSWVTTSGERSTVLGDAVGAHLAAAWGRGPARLGLTMPVYWWTSGDLHETGATTLGDPGLSLKLAPLRTDRGGVGVALVAGITVPMGASRRQLGHPGVTGHVSAIGELNRGPVWVVANVGLQGTPMNDLRTIAVDDAFVAHLAGAVDVAERWSPGVEVTSRVPLQGAEVGTVPVEVLAFVHHRHPAGWGVHGAVGRGVSPGIGAPGLRLLLGVSWRAPGPVEG